jgi:hypothetical protein
VVAVQVCAIAMAAAGESGSYQDLVRLYAAGERAAAVAGLQRFTEVHLAKELDAIRDQVALAMRCRSCPPTTEGFPLRAAVMLHTDRDEMERRPVLITGERAPTCGPPVQAQLAESALLLLLGDEDGREFARRWYLAMALRSLGDICFLEGRDWAAAGLKRFAKEKELLLVRGMLGEATVALASLRVPTTAGLNPLERERARELEMEGRALLVDACRFYEQALAVDPGFEEALLHLGRARLRLDQEGAALASLESLVAKSRRPAHLYLAHLFAGRVHESARRAPVAEREYRAALAVLPGAQAAAMALAHVRLMAGDADAVREILDASLGHAGSRASPDPFWEYQLGPARASEPLFEALREEATQ